MTHTDLLSACENASQVLAEAVLKKQILAGSIFIEQSATRFAANYGLAQDAHAAYLLGSITKPIAISALMTLFDEECFALDDPLIRYLPEFSVGAFPQVTIRHLLTHTSGLPDQVPGNEKLRSEHKPLKSFVDACNRLKFGFSPGSNYEYSSMGILLACAIAEKISSVSIHQLVADRVLAPLEMKDSALGIGSIPEANRMPVQIEFAAPEAGGGAADASGWDWNSPYWRALGAPWGGAHASASDVGKFLRAMMSDQDDFLRGSTKRLMRTNQNPSGFESRGLGLDVDMRSSKVSSSANSFGHSGSTGTLAWAEPDTKRICVVLTTLPARALPPAGSLSARALPDTALPDTALPDTALNWESHPRHLASEWIAKAWQPKP